MPSIQPLSAKKRWARIAWSTLIVLTSGISLGTVERVLWVRSTLRMARTRPDPERMAEVHAEFPNLRDVAFRTADGLTLRGWFLPGSRGSTVVFVHGGGGNRLELLADARIVAKYGHGVLLYDSRASGDSEGDLVTWGDREQLDVVASLDFLCSQSDVDPKRIALLGFSMGASSVAVVAARDARVRALVLYATWSSLEDEMKYKAGRFGMISYAPVLAALRWGGVSVRNVRPIDVLPELHPRPLLMMAGGLDEDTPLWVMSRVFTAAREPKEFWIDPEAKHGSHALTEPRAFEAKIASFLERAL